MSFDKKRMHKSENDNAPIDEINPYYTGSNEVVFPQAPLVPGQKGYFTDADAIPFDEEDYPPDKPEK